MGFSTTRFSSPPDPNLLCSVCGGVLEGAVLTPCGHSFCSPCLHTWIRTCPTCPECRARVTPTLVKPVHALRNLVRNLRVWCDHRQQGCGEVVELDRLPHHLATCCPRHPVPCAGCALEVPRFQLAEHHVTCFAIAATIEDNDDDDDDREKQTEEEEEGEKSWQELRHKIHGPKPLTTNDVSLMLCRIRVLETRADHLFQDLSCARSKTLALERELDNLSVHFHNNHHHHKQRHRHDICHFRQESRQGCARIPETFGELSLLIARHLLTKPREIKAEEVFGAIGRCYDNFHTCGPSGRHDVHMLLATAFASNWFSAAQRVCLQGWLKMLTKTSFSSSLTTRPSRRLFNS